jgi:hypothetical protein
LILTAGVPELQKTKLKALSLDKFDYLVVYDGEAKPNALLEYIEKNLGYIPNKIVVYEDRPNHFIERKKELEKTL